LAASGEGDNPEDHLDRHYNYGPLSFDRRHAFVATYVWALPRLAQQNPIMRTAFGSWQLNGVIRLQDRPVLYGHRQHLHRQSPRRLPGRRRPDR
jgi:hypothetical protein